MSTDIFYRFLLKFGQEDHMKALYHHGELYCNTIQYFRELENPKQGDKNEGCTFSKPAIIKNIRAIDGSFNVDLDIPGIYRKHDPLFKRNLYCLYGADQGFIEEYIAAGNMPFIDRSEFDFGEYFIIINNPREFRNRVIEELQKRKLNFKIAPITYIDNSKYEGEMGIFKKSDYYKGQRELRISIDMQSDIAQSIFIGPMHDIAEGIYPIASLDSIRIRKEI